MIRQGTSRNCQICAVGQSHTRPKTCGVEHFCKTSNQTKIKINKHPNIGVAEHCKMNHVTVHHAQQKGWCSKDRTCSQGTLKGLVELLREYPHQTKLQAKTYKSLWCGQKSTSKTSLEAKSIHHLPVGILKCIFFLGFPGFPLGFLRFSLGFSWTMVFMKTPKHNLRPTKSQAAQMDPPLQKLSSLGRDGVFFQRSRVYAVYFLLFFECFLLLLFLLSDFDGFCCICSKFKKLFVFSDIWLMFDRMFDGIVDRTQIVFVCFLQQRVICAMFGPRLVKGLSLGKEFFHVPCRVSANPCWNKTSFGVDVARVYQ